MNDNDLSMTPFWARAFRGNSPESLRAALGVLSGLIDDPDMFTHMSRAIRIRMMNEACYVMPSQRILFEVAEKHGLTVAELKGRCRTRFLSWARQEAYFRLKTELKLSFPRIGRIMAARDHTTILDGFKKHRERENALGNQTSALSGVIDGGDEQPSQHEQHL